MKTYCDTPKTFLLLVEGKHSLSVNIVPMRQERLQKNMSLACFDPSLLHNDGDFALKFRTDVLPQKRFADGHIGHAHAQEI